MTITIKGRPISKKNSRRIFMRGRYPTSLPSEAYVRFEKEAIKQLELAALTYFDGYDDKKNKLYKSPVAISNKCHINYVFHLKGLGNVDGDNLQAGINDILQKAGIILNDRQMRSWSGEIFEGCDDWQTFIEITEL